MTKRPYGSSVSANRCIEISGAKDVRFPTLGHEKVRITVMLCAEAHGSKCKQYVLINRKRRISAIAEKLS